MEPFEECLCGFSDQTENLNKAFHIAGDFNLNLQELYMQELINMQGLYEANNKLLHLFFI